MEKKKDDKTRATRRVSSDEINKKVSKKGLFGKKKEIKQTAEQNQMILEIKKMKLVHG